MSDLAEQLYESAHFAWRMAPPFVRSVLDVEDAVQDAVLHCLKAGDKYREGEATRHVFLALCARRQMIQQAIAASRKSKRTRSMDFDYGEGRNAERVSLYSSDSEPCDAAAHREQVARLMACIDSLPDEQRHVITYHCFLGIPMATLGLAEGVTPQAMCKREAKAMHNLTRGMLGARIQP